MSVFRLTTFQWKMGDFLKAYLKVQKAVEGMQKDGFAHPTYFELLFAMAMVILKKSRWNMP